MRSIELIRCEACSLTSPDPTRVRNLLISISIRSVMPSYLAMRCIASSNSWSFLAVRSDGRKVYIRSTRFENSSISFLALCKLSSAVESSVGSI